MSEKEDARGSGIHLPRLSFIRKAVAKVPIPAGLIMNVCWMCSPTGREVWHLLPAQIVSPAKMQLDWTVRYENMRQHTGQHILSACFKSRHDLDTVAVHLGQELTMIELKTTDIDVEAILLDTEQAANKIIREGHPVNSRFVKRDELGSIRFASLC